MQARKDLIYPNNGLYSNIPQESIFKHIMGKKDLTLADAMLVCKYADNNFIKKVLNAINSAQIQDDRFKSYTLSEKFAKHWAKDKDFCDDENMLSMVTRANIKKGNQVGYSSKSGQFEFILNNNNKKITFANAQYDKANNAFVFDSEIEAIN